MNRVKSYFFNVMCTKKRGGFRNPNERREKHKDEKSNYLKPKERERNISKSTIFLMVSYISLDQIPLN